MNSESEGTDGEPDDGGNDAAHGEQPSGGAALGRALFPKQLAVRDWATHLSTGLSSTSSCSAIASAGWGLLVAAGWGRGRKPTLTTKCGRGRSFQNGPGATRTRDLLLRKGERPPEGANP